MSEERYQEVWKDYQAAWANISDAERRELLERSVAADCVYADPAGDAEGLEALIAYVGRFQQQFPGARFENDALLVHHDQALATWRRLDPNGGPPAPGNSYAQFGSDGRLVRMTGFPRKD